jgi:folate-binding protein YgfZ
MCSPTGQIRAVLYCWRRHGTEVGIVADEMSAQHLLKTVEEAVIMEDVQARVASRSAILGPTRGECDSERLSGYLWHQFGATERAPEDNYPLQCYLFYERLPALGIDITETTLPAELGESVMRRYVSLNKGCYVGQEVIMRQHSRGRVNWNWAKAIFPLDLKDAAFDFGPKAQVQRVMIYHNRVEIGARVHTDVIEDDFEVGGVTFRFKRI